MIRLVLPLALLAGCAQHTPEIPVQGETGHVCNADTLGDLVGKPASGDLGVEAIRRSGAASLRWIQPGTAVTMDFRQDRINLHLDASNMVTSLACG